MYREKILIIEDSQSLVYIIEKLLKEQGYNTVCAYNGKDAIEALLQENICLAIIDIGLPDISGLEIIEKIRGVSQELPIIVISSAKDINEEIVIYKKGAKLFHKKPISFKLLEAQITNLLPSNGRNVFVIKDIQIDKERDLVLKKDCPVSLTKKERHCLIYLAELDGQTCTREMILKRLTLDFNDKTEHCVDTLICRIRRKLDYENIEEIIETVSGVGYRISK